MAQPQGSRRKGTESEEVTRLQQQAVAAANAFRDYIVGGDPARRQAFWTIYNTSFGGATYHDNSVFMNKLFQELDRVGQDAQVRPVFDAFVASRGRLFGFLWSNPVHFTDFIDTVYNIRTLLGRAPPPERVRALVTQVQGSEGRPARADSQIGRIRAAMQATSGLTVEDAVRADFERGNREEALQRYDQGLVDIVWANMPRQLAARAATALRQFILTGDDANGRLFRSIWDANTGQAFTDAFTSEFRARIYQDSRSGLAPIAQAYNTAHSGIDPNEFANMITRLYRAAATGTVQDVETLRQAEGANVIDPLLRIVAQGMAGRAITLLRDVLETGNVLSKDAFVAILNGRLAVVANNAVQMVTVENNEVFWAEFTRMYGAEISQNSRLATLVRSFQRNILPIAVRDIYTELARASPDTARLNSDYGPDLVGLVAGNAGSISWMMRPDSDLSAEITRRARAEDPAAVRINGLRVTFSGSRAASLRDVYGALVAERIAARTREAPDVVAVIEQNFDSLSYLSGSPADVQRELDRRARARPPDAVAAQLKARFPANAGEALSRAYAAIRDARGRRAQLVQRYGQEFVDAVSANLDNFQWVMRPVEDIDREMRSRRDDAFVRSANATVGYSVGNLAHGLRDIYAVLGRSSPDRAALVTRYGENLVAFVETNRTNLAWLGGDLASVERTLQDPSTNALIRQAQGYLYSYTPVQLVSAIARARSAISRRGLALADATDAYGTVFVGPVVSRQAVSTPSISATSQQQVIESRCVSIIRDFEAIDSQLRWNVLEPARILVQERIRLWRAENDAIRLEARSTQDPAALAALERRLQILINSMMTPADMRKAVEMSFAMIHLAETGGDMSRAPALDVSTTDIDIGTLRRLMEWYRGLGTGGKAPVVGEIVSAVLFRADPNLYRFITGVEEPGMASAISRTYALTQRRGADTRQTLVGIYGEPFVALVESQAGNLRVLESPAVMSSPTATMQALRMAQNELYASIVIRVYRAIQDPRAGEDRAAMITLFGEPFVLAVEAQRAQLTTLGSGTAGLEQIRALPQPVRQALFAAYPAAYAQSVGRIGRMFRSQDDYMFRSMSAVYSVLRERPARGAAAEATRAFEARVQQLYAAYGEQFVRTVEANRAQLAFLESPTSSPADLARLQPEAREGLNVAFETGPAAGRANFMTNFMRVADQLPRVYTQLRGALAFSNPTDTLPTTFANAIQYYRDQFGSNDYLFTQYINLDFLSRNFQRLARQYHMENRIPAYILDGIDTPEELSRFLSSDVGRDLIVAGRNRYGEIETQYLAQRQDQNFHPTTGEYTDDNVTNLRNRISILDALYLGMALPDIGATSSAFSRAAATATFNAMIVISNRDPYLVGPFLLQVLPAIISVAQDERTIVAAVEAFTQIFVQRYESGTREIAYSTALNRRYFLEVFARIGARLPEVASNFDHTRLEDELRLTPEPRTDEGYLSPLLYRYRPGFWNGDGLEPLPTLYGQQNMPIRLLPQPFMPTNPFLPVPGGFRIDSGASGLFSSMYDQLRPPADRMFRQRVPQRFRIGAIGSSTVIRRINQLFGPMPVDYNDYWLSGFGETGGFYAHEQRGPAARDRGGAAATGGGRTISGGTRGTARWTREQLETAPPATEGQPSTTTGTTTDIVDVTASSVRLPPPMSGPVPLPLFGIVPYDMFGMGGQPGSAYVAKSESEISAELERRRTADDGVVRDIYRLRPNGTAAAFRDTYLELMNATPNRARLERSYGREFVELIASNRQYLNWALAQSPEFGAGIHRARQEFHYETASAETRVTTPGAGSQPGVTTVTDQQTRGRTRGLLETYQRIARQSQTDMLFFVAGEHVPEITGTGGATTQAPEDRLKTRLYFVTREGDVYQLAYGLDTRAQLLNYLYAGANTQQALASARAIGRQMLTSDSAAGGFDGAAVGFTIPRTGGDSFSALAIGQLVRSLSTMDPVHAEQAVGMAVTNMLSDRRQRDVYAAFYRGAEMVTVDPQNRAHISDSRFAEGTGEVMWRRMRVDPMAYQAEVRVVGGMPLTVGARGRFEWRPSRYQTNAFGITAAYSGIDLLRETRAAGVDSDEIYGRMNTILTSLYGWSEDEARDTGWLAAGSYMYARMEDWTVRNPDGSYTTTRAGPEGTPENHFASAMFMYWAQRHGILMGAQRVPGWSRIYDRIDQAMRQVQQNPSNEAQILSNLSNALRQDLQRDIWRIALAYGYDGERVRVYTIGGGQYVNDETAYGNLYALALFGRPTAAFVDILGHAYGYSPLVISEDTSAAGFTVKRDRYTPFLDLYAGVGVVDWPNVSLSRYQTEVAIRGSADISGALRDVYREMGGTRNRSRLIRNYGEGLVGIAEEGRASLAWMIRPEAQVRTEMQTRFSADDVIVTSFLNLRRGRESGRQAVRAEDAAALIDIYRELRASEPDRSRLETAYSRELVDLVERNATDLDWVMLPPERTRAELARRAQTAGSVEARLSESQIPALPAQADLTGPEVKRLMEQNMLDVLVGATGAQSRVGLSPERYDVLLGSHLGSPQGRRARGRTFYVLHTPVAERAEARGSLVIGDETDLDEWMRHGHEIGRGITRLEIAQPGSDYTFTFSGDRRLRALTAARLVGGITIPVRPDDYSNFQVGSSWTVGGLVQLLQDHRFDLLSGAMYGRREYGNERWDQWTVTVSGRLQGASTATFSDQWYGYVFFNRATKSVVFASDSVFENADEMRSVCQTLGGSQCTSLTELSRTTGGVGLEWARTDVLTGDRFSFHFFFEGGAESYERFGGAGTTGADGTYTMTPNRDNEFIFRSGAAFSYTQQSPNSTIPNIYSVGLTGQSGTWPLLPGEITRPEFLQSYESTVGAGIPGWSFMLHGRVQW